MNTAPTWEPQSTGEAIRILRERRGWSQIELAARMRALGVPISGAHLSRIEANARRPQVAQLFALAEIFDVRLADLGVDEENYPELHVIRKAVTTRRYLSGARPHLEILHGQKDLLLSSLVPDRKA